MSISKNTPPQSEGAKTTTTSRRNFLKPLAVGAVAAGVGVFEVKKSLAETTPEITTIRIPKETAISMSETPRVGSFEGKGMLGADVFARLCKEENLAAMFMCPGNYTVTHAIAATGIPCYGGRTEGSMCSAADGFARATGEVVACSGTEGPGITHMVMNIAAAHFARSPLLVLASNMDIGSEDSERGIQIMYQQPVTEGIKKYGKRLITPNRVHEYGGYAFRALKSGVPGPVHLDFPGEVARARFTDPSQLTNYYDKSKYRSESRAVPAPKDILAAIDMINKAERPILVAGHGVFHRKAWDALKRAVEKHEIAVVCSGPMRGHFPDDHRLSISQSPNALMSADLVIFVGQYSMPNVGEYRFNPDIKAIRVHPVQEDLGRNWPLDLGIVGDEFAFLESLADQLPRKKRDKWVSEIAAAQAEYVKSYDDVYKLGVKYSRDTGFVHPSVIGKELNEFLYHGKVDPLQTIVASGGYTAPRFVNYRLHANRPGQKIVPPYQFGAIGPDLAMAIGAAVAQKEGVGPQKAHKGAPTVVVTTDAGMGYSLFEMETAAKYKIPVIGIVYNNNAWGTWANTDGVARSQHLHLFQENLRYDQMAQGLGCRGEYVRTPEEFRAALERSYDIAVRESLPTLINVQALKEFTAASLYPPGLITPSEPTIAGHRH
jgi:thiamine pyrophosphate-dependent acetolactate synthase large subunit-like protein